MRRVNAVSRAAVKFGAEILRRREAQGLSQPELAARSGLTPNYIGGIELGTRDPSLSTVLALSKGLGVPPGELFESRGGLSPASIEAARIFHTLPSAVQGVLRSLLETIAAPGSTKPRA